MSMRAQTWLTIAAATALSIAAISSAQAPAATGQPAKPPAAPAAAGAEITAQPIARPAQAAGAAGVPFADLARVEVRGKGPIPMVLVPGLFCDWTVFDKFMAGNAERYTMYAVTLPGFGGSSPPGKPPEPINYGTLPWLRNAEEGILKLVADRKLDKPVIVGHSMGGQLAMRLAAEHPDTFRAAVSIDGWPAFPIASTSLTGDDRASFISNFYARGMAGISVIDWNEQTRNWMPTMVTAPERKAALTAMAILVPKDTGMQYMLEMLAADARGAMATQTRPVLIVVAVPPKSEEPDAMPMSEWRRRWRDETNFPNTTVVFFEKTRHFIMDDAPQDLDRAIEQFLAGKAVEGKGQPEPDEASPAPPTAATGATGPAPSPSAPTGAPAPTGPTGAPPAAPSATPTGPTGGKPPKP